MGCTQPAALFCLHHVFIFLKTMAMPTDFTDFRLLQPSVVTHRQTMRPFYVAVFVPGG